MNTLPNEELTVAREVVQFLLGRGTEQTPRVGRDTVTFRVPPREGWRLHSVVFSRDALRKLLSDPARPVKIEYLRRDIARVATQREEYRYPHVLPRASRLAVKAMAL